ncbi:MAG: hypothetical protein CXT69_03300 [Methanobacteriota archaeon]|jgi:hypothetical protein|nr:MAG: hypothetical protein CXT69_03300 [Euryarchaeota archaeon]
MSKLFRLLKHQSPRIILVKGERGSGRTSLLHSLASQTERFYSLTMLPSEDPAHRVLGETFATIVGFDQPPHYTLTVEKLVSEMAGHTGTLPLLTYDYPNATGAQMVEVFGRLVDHLRRFRALVLITVTPAQLASFPEELISSFDEVDELKPLDEEALCELVNRRMREVSRIQWSLPTALSKCILDETGGHVGRTVRLLRDLFDYARKEKEIDDNLISLKAAFDALEGEDSEGQYSLMSGKYAPEYIPSSIEEALGESGVSDDSATIVGKTNAPLGPNNAIVAQSEGISTKSSMRIDPVDEGKKERITDILEDDNNADSPFEFSMFDDGIAESGVIGEGVESIEVENNEVSGDTSNPLGDYVSESSLPMPRGPFGSLTSRNRQANFDSPRFEKDSKLPNYTDASEKPNIQDGGSDLWHATDAPLPEVEKENEEIAIPTVPMQNQFTASLPHQGLPIQAHHPLPQPHPLPHPPGALPARLPTEQPLPPNALQPHIRQYSPLHGAHIPSKPPSMTNLGDVSGEPANMFANGLAGRLTALNQPQPQQPPQSVALNAEHLRNLCSNEALLIETALQREFSPSDETLMNGLNVRRPRMSQLCNGLQKAGIFKVRKIGRSRLFSITNDARAQMIAWGLLEG